MAPYLLLWFGIPAVVSVLLGAVACFLLRRHGVFLRCFVPSVIVALGTTPVTFGSGDIGAALPAVLIIIAELIDGESDMHYFTRSAFITGTIITGIVASVLMLVTQRKTVKEPGIKNRLRTK